MTRSIRTLGWLLLACSAIAVSPVSAQEVDTSGWLCELCPFNTGADGDVRAGMTVASDDSAYFGDATGYDESGAYADLDVQGTYAGDEYLMRWRARDLLLDSRSVSIDGGHPGWFDYHAELRQLPRHEFVTTETVFAQSGGDTLLLPDGWVTAPLTSGMSALDASLGRVDIASDRTDLSLGGKYQLSRSVTASLDYRRLGQDGRRIVGGSSYTTASLLPAPFDYVTDEVSLSVEYSGAQAFAAMAWTLSEFSNANPALTFESPFTAAAGAERPALAQAPDSRLQLISLRGGYHFPVMSTSVSASLSAGEITQDSPFLAYTTNANIATEPLPRSNLDGSVDITRYAIAISARPLPRARLRLSLRHDERDNRTDRLEWNRVIVDTFNSGETELNTPYSFDRTTLNARASLDVLDRLKLEGSVERRETDRDYQEVAEQTEDTGWLGMRWHVGEFLDLRARGGTAKRDINRYDDAVAMSLDQNPLLRKYNLAYRFREFVDIDMTIAPVDWPVTVSIEGLYADDSYTKSRLGLISGREFRWAADLGWAISDRLNWYVNIGGDELESLQRGSEAFSEPDWAAAYDDRFASLSTGLRIRQIADKVNLRIDYRVSDSNSEIKMDSVVGGDDAFPDFATRLESLRLFADYRWSDRLRLEFGVSWQTFEADDWMLQGVDPATIPEILSLGADPYDDEQLLLSIGFRYDLAGPAADEQ